MKTTATQPGSLKLFALSLMFACAQACAQHIPYSAAMQATASSNIADNRNATRAINNSGMNASDQHGATNTDMWMTANLNNLGGFADVWFRVDLGDTYRLNAIKIWNFNLDAYPNRGVQKIDIYVSSDGAANAVSGSAPDFADDAWTLIAADHTVAKAPSKAGYAGDAAIEFAPVAARWVAFKIKSNYGSDTYGNYVGLSEVRFYANGTPAVTLGDTAMTSATTLAFSGTLDSAGADTTAHILSCRGITDGGTDFGAWDVVTEHGEIGEGDFAYTLGDIAPDYGYYVTLAATNSAVAWANQTEVFIAGHITVEAPADFYENDLAAYYLTFRRPENSTNVPITATYRVGGTAEAGTHYRALPGSVTFDEGVSTVTQKIVALDNNSAEDRTVAVTLDAGNYLTNATSGATFSILGKAAGAERITWTGGAGDKSWHSPGNWSPARVPTLTDDVLFTADGIGSGNIIVLESQAQINSLTVDGAPSFTLGAAASPKLIFSALTNNAADTLIFGTRATLVADVSGVCEWRVNSGLRIIGGLAAANGTTLRKTGTGTINVNSAIHVEFFGAWEIVEGSVSATVNNAMYGTVTIGGGDTAAAVNVSKDFQEVFTGNKSVTVLTNGTFSCNNLNHGRIYSVHAKEGGNVNLSADYFYCLRAHLTGGRMTGGQFYNGGSGQELRSYASDTMAVFDSKFNFSTIYNATLSAEDGSAFIDLDIRRNLNVGNSSQTITRNGAGTIRMTSANSLNFATFKCTAGVTLFDNASDSGSGTCVVQVDAGATVGGTGFIGGTSDKTKITLEGNASKSATLAPGTIDADTGAHVIGTLTVGSESFTNNVTFNNYSQLRAHVGKRGANDMLNVYGAVSIAGTGTTLDIDVAENAAGGAYVLARATEGVSGAFASVTVNGKDADRFITYTDTDVVYDHPFPPGVIIIR